MIAHIPHILALNDLCGSLGELLSSLHGASELVGASLDVLFLVFAILVLVLSDLRFIFVLVAL